MSDYTKSTNFASKDTLTSGDPLKIVKGTEIDTEFTSIETAVNSKVDESSGAMTGGTINSTTIGATTPATGAFTTLSASGTATLTGGFTVGATAAPAFSVYLSGNQTVSSAAFTKIAFNSEEFDTASAFDSTTNYRFTPLVTGYYQFNLSFFNSGGTVCFGNIYKNGSNVVSGSRTDVATTNGSMLSYLIYLNGSTDYVEFYGYTTTSTTFVGTNVGGACKASGFLARSA